MTTSTLSSRICVFISSIDSFVFPFWPSFKRSIPIVLANSNFVRNFIVFCGRKFSIVVCFCGLEKKLTNYIVREGAKSVLLWSIFYRLYAWSA